MTLWTGNRGRGVALVLGILMTSAVARAADLESVEALIRQGVELRQQRHDVRALPLFQKAYGMTRTPRTAGQLGLCEMALGYWLDAEHHISEALGFPEHPWVARNLGDLTGALASVRSNISEITVTGEPTGADVLVNGQSVGRLPLTSPLRIGKGVADIELRATGYAPGTRSLKIAGGNQETVNIVLTRVAQPAAPVAAAPEEPNRPVTPPSSPPPTEQDAPRTNPRRIAAWATGAAAGLSLVFGVIETVAWVQKLDQFDNHIGPLLVDPTIMDKKNCGAKQMNFGGPGCQALHDDLTHARTLTFVGYGLAAALGVTSAVLFATSKPDRSKGDMAFACAPDLVSRGVGCAFSF